MEQKKADSPTADTNLMDKDSQRNAADPSTHWRNPKMTLEPPATKVPQRKRLRKPILSTYLPKRGENTIVVRKTEPYTWKYK